MCRSAQVALAAAAMATQAAEAAQLLVAVSHPPHMAAADQLFPVQPVTSSTKSSQKLNLLLKGNTLLAKIKSRKGSRAVMERKDRKPQGAATAKDDSGSNLGKAVAV